MIVQNKGLNETIQPAGFFAKVGKKREPYKLKSHFSREKRKFLRRSYQPEKCTEM